MFHFHTRGSLNMSAYFVYTNFAKMPNRLTHARAKRLTEAPQTLRRPSYRPNLRDGAAGYRALTIQRASLGHNPEWRSDTHRTGARRSVNG